MRGRIGWPVLATLLIAGCSSHPATAPSSTTSPTTGVAPAEHGSLAHCLHEHGIPDSTGSVVLGPPDGVDQQTWDRAMKACSTLGPGPAS